MLDIRLLFVAVAWGINFSAIKVAMADFHPLGFTVLRFLLGSLFLALVMLAGREPFAIERADRLKIIRLGLTGITLYNIFFMYGLKYTTAANSALLISLSPLAGALLAPGRERMNVRTGTGLVLATGGAALVIASRHGGLTFKPAGLSGDLLTLCATVAWAFYSVTAKPLLEKYSAVKITAYSMLAGSILLLPVSIPGILGQSWSAVTPPSWSALAFSACVAGALSYVLWYQGIKRIGVTRTMVYHYLMPFAALLFAAVMLDEALTGMQVAGGVGILAGVYLVQGKPGR